MSELAHPFLKLRSKTDTCIFTPCVCPLRCVLTQEARGFQTPRGPSLPTPQQWVQSRLLALCPGRGLCAWVRGCGPSRSALPPRPHPRPLRHQVLHAVGRLLCLHTYASLAQSAARLDSDRTPSASSTAERGMVKPMVRVEQQLDYRRQDSRWGPALGA